MSGGPRIRGDEATLAAEGIASTTTPSAAGPALVGGRYAILGLVGVGGMGSVYRARDTELDEVVALKVLRKELVEMPGMLERFRQEVKLARRVTHTNIARTFDIGEHEGEKYLTMEYVDGGSLAELAGDGPMPLHKVLTLTRGICAGLSAAHAAGVVHRDLKPDNVLVDRDGRVVITDFGIARALRDGDAVVKTQGRPIGTPAYMAPEQVQGVADVDARADLYALGAMLYEMLTGERAWPGESVFAVAAARLVEPPPDPRKKTPAIPLGVAAVVLRCMARDRDVRFTSAEEVLHALDHATAAATPAPAGRPAVRPSTRPGPEATKNVAVLPFRNQGPAEDEYIADGLTDDLIDGLSMTRGLRVQARGAVMRFKAGDRDARAIGRELDVQVVVDGSVRRMAGKLRVNARLVSVADGFQLWAKRFDCPESEFLAVGDAAANAIAEALTVARDLPAREAPTDPLAIDLYLRARHAYHAGWSLNVDRAVALFEQALAHAPEDPRILAGYALSLVRRFSFDPDGTESAGEAAKSAAERALAKDPTLGEARMALANHALIVGDGVACARAVREALAVAPGSADVHDLRGRLLCEVGRPEDALASIRTAIKLEPSNERARGDLVRMRVFLGDWKAVDDMVARSELAPGSEGVEFVLCARLALWKRDVDLMRRLRSRAEGIDFAFRSAVLELTGLGLSGVVSPGLLGMATAWGKISGRALRRPIFFRQLAAEVAAFAGRRDEALGAIESAAHLGLIDRVWMDGCPLLDGLRESPRYVAARAAVEVRAEAVLAALEGR
jgi:eukaryotic-like serine/threonine-protein kinase